MTRHEKLAVLLHSFEESWPDLAHRIEGLRKELSSDDLVMALLVQAVEAMGARDAGLLPDPHYLEQ